MLVELVAARNLRGESRPLAGLGSLINRSFPLLAAAALVVGLVGALWIDWRAPIWLDEEFTVAIAHADLRGLYAWCLDDPNAPLYYALAWLWSHVTPFTPLLMRLPSTVLWLSTLVFVAARGHSDRDTRLAWAAMLALWIPGWQYASEARCYALLMLLSCVQAVLFIRMIGRRRRIDAFAWAAVAALACATHYYAMLPTLLQGLAFFAFRPRDALKAWPAGLLFVPVLAWLSLHLPHLALYAAPDTSWYPPLTFTEAGDIISNVWGGLPFHLAIAVMVCLAIQIQVHRKSGTSLPYSTGEMLVAAAALVAFALIIGMAFFRPALQTRYLIPTVPGIFLGITLVLRNTWSGSRVPLAILLSAWMLWAMTDIGPGWRNFTDDRYSYNFEQPSAWMLQRDVKRFTFFWDHPNAGLYGAQRLTDMGSGPLHRGGWNGPASSLLLHDAAIDPNVRLAEIASRPGDGFIWAFDSKIPHSLGSHYPPLFPKDRDSWTCRNFGRHSITMLACLRR